jgi:hypothetical protein
MSHLVVDGLVQVFDKNVALTRLAERRVTLGPHNAAAISLSVLPLRPATLQTHHARFLINE